MTVHPVTRAGRARVGQGLLEYVPILAAVLIAVLVGARQFGDRFDHLLDNTTMRVARAARMLEDSPPWSDEREQDEPGADDSPTGGIVVAGAPPLAPAPGHAGGGHPGSIGGGLGGGGGGAPRSPSSGPGNPPGSGVPPQPPAQPAPSTGLTNIAALTASQQAAIDAARELLAHSSSSFALCDFALGLTANHAAADVVDGLAQHGVPILAGDVGGALAITSFFTNEDGTFNALAPVLLVFDRTWLAGVTAQMIAAVLTHEAWHVEQLFTGIHDDFTNYPRVVDIEYEAFVAGAAVWDALNGSQSEASLDAGSQCVAGGEARCNEILATDFHYPTGPRRHG